MRTRLSLFLLPATTAVNKLVCDKWSGEALGKMYSVYWTRILTGAFLGLALVATASAQFEILPLYGNQAGYTVGTAIAQEKWRGQDKFLSALPRPSAGPLAVEKLTHRKMVEKSLQ